MILTEHMKFKLNGAEWPGWQSDLSAAAATIDRISTTLCDDMYWTYPMQLQIYNLLLTPQSPHIHMI